MYKKLFGVLLVLYLLALLELPCSIKGFAGESNLEQLQSEFQKPGSEFSLIPFWFWNDTLKKDEIIRQIDDFDKHGVHGFLIHPRIGLPEKCTWLCPEMIEMMRTALQEAQKRGMKVLLYDDGMYPSGSSSGQVAAENPNYASKGFMKIDLKKGEDPPAVEKGGIRIGIFDRPNGDRIAVDQVFAKGHIRGLHYIGDENKKGLREELPPAADLLCPEAVQCFIRLVYQKYHDEFRSFFEDRTIMGIFTDEPSIMGRGPRKGMVPGSKESLQKIEKILGYDFTPFLPDLWYQDRPDSDQKQKDYYRAAEQVLEDVYYGSLSKWCLDHHVDLCGHPEASSDFGILRKMGIPGQDIVWRYIEPGEKAFSPEHSMMGKVASSAMLHAGERRNLNEICGAFGHDLTFEEMQWVANWCIIRGQNLLVPHAFYYSIRGPRWEERPPDVGPNAVWWNRFKPFADQCSRLCWLNTDCQPIIRIALLAPAKNVSSAGTKTLFENQIDFNYLEYRDLFDRASVDEKGVRIAKMKYDLLILVPGSQIPSEALPALEKLAASGHLLRYTKDAPKFDHVPIANDDEDLVRIIRSRIGSDIRLISTEKGDQKNIRARHLVKGSVHFYLLFNEANTPVSVKIRVPISGAWSWWDPVNGQIRPDKKNDEVNFAPFEIKILAISGQ
ncbi:MAG: hypothetical protein Q4G69_02550 [Planctomycetia bacterium]|nr:hypothetical protein [Planctomycetia bacterium]